MCNQFPCHWNTSHLTTTHLIHFTIQFGICIFEMPSFYCHFCLLFFFVSMWNESCHENKFGWFRCCCCGYNYCFCYIFLPNLNAQKFNFVVIWFRKVFDSKMFASLSFFSSTLQCLFLLFRVPFPVFHLAAANGFHSFFT